MGLEVTPAVRRRAALKVRSVATDQPLVWLAAAWRDMRANPIASLSYGLLFAIAGDLITIFAWQSWMRSATDCALKPPNTTECTAPMRAQASMAIAASGTMGR